MTYAGERRWPARVVAVGVTAFVVLSLGPYLTGGTRVPSTFGLHYPVLVAHVVFGSVAISTAVAQVWPGLRARRPRVHRYVGALYLASAVPAALCALAIGAATPFGPLLAVSNVALAALWLWFTVNGYLAVRRGAIGSRRRHMVRSATLAFSVVTNRLWSPILYLALQPLRDSVFGGDEQHLPWLAAGVGGWLGWMIPLLVVQCGLARRPARRSTIAPPPDALRV